MKNVHIALVGGQTAPVYCGIIEEDPDLVVLVHSAESADIADKIAKKISQEVLMREIVPFDMKEIEREALFLADNYANDEVSVNLSGGSKIWMLLFFRIFSSNPCTRLFFIDQNNCLWNLRTNESKKISTSYLSILLSLQGNIPTAYHRISEYDDDDDDVANAIFKIRQSNCPAFTQLTSKLSPDWEAQLGNKERGTFNSKRGFVAWDRESQEVDITLYKGCQEKAFHLSSPNVISLVFNSGWFEYYVASLFRDRYQDILLNCIFGTATGKAKNEVDIIVNTGEKLLFVECKTALFRPTDIDKFHSVVQNYGGNGSKAIFITLDAVSKEGCEKCHDNNIPFYVISAHLHHEKDDLYRLIDKELMKTNK